MRKIYRIFERPDTVVTGFAFAIGQAAEIDGMLTEQVFEAVGGRAESTFAQEPA